MANYYKRKRISNMADLDIEEAKIRKKLRKIEQEWAEILDPQQLAIGFLTSFITNRIRRRKNLKTSDTSGKKTMAVATQKRAGQGFKKALKVAAVSIFAVLAIKKILKRRKKMQPVVQPAT